jgi:hypothetical protein
VKELRITLREAIGTLFNSRIYRDTPPFRAERFIFPSCSGHCKEEKLTSQHLFSEKTIKTLVLTPFSC